MSADLVAQLAAAEAEVARLRHALAVAAAPEALSIGCILVEVAGEFGVEVRHLCSEMRSQRYAQPRQAAMGLARALTGRSYPTIGRILKRDHTTVVMGCRSHQRRMAADPDYAAHVRAVSERLQRRLTHVEG